MQCRGRYWMGVATVLVIWFIIKIPMSFDERIVDLPVAARVCVAITYIGTLALLFWLVVSGALEDWKDKK